MRIHEVGVHAGDELQSWQPTPAQWTPPQPKPNPTQWLLRAAVILLVAVLGAAVFSVLDGGPATNDVADSASSTVTSGEVAQPVVVVAVLSCSVNVTTEHTEYGTDHTIDAEQRSYLEALHEPGDSGIDMRVALHDSDPAIFSVAVQVEVSPGQSAVQAADSFLEGVNADPIGGALGCQITF